MRFWQRYNDPGFLQKKAVYHTLFWLSYYVFAVLIALSIHRIYDGKFYIALLDTSLPDVLLVYWNIYWLIPALLFKRKFVLYFGVLLVSIFLQSALEIWLHRLYALAGTEAFAPVKDFTLRNFSIQALNAIYLLGLTMGLKFVKDRMLQNQLLQEKEKQHTDMELHLLKSQLQPHFFFNTLNNLYSLTIQKSDLAPEVVLKLSDLMSYMLYESGAATVTLDKEISHLRHYIDIEKLRFGPRLALSFTVEGNTEPVKIPPMLLFSFVENSFKHGLHQTIGAGRVDLSLCVQHDQLNFRISNPVGPERNGTMAMTGARMPEERELEGARAEERNHGIGLRNVVRRLDLLYGSGYTLDLVQTGELFCVHLKIPLP